MFIQHLRIDRFGSVTNLALDHLTRNITVIRGGPRTGKTTLLQFARAVLYGFDDSTRSRYLPPAGSSEYGGEITWSRGDHQYTIRRHDDGKFNGHFEVVDDGHPGRRVALTETLQGVSADLYSRLFAVDFAHRPDVSGLLGEAANCGFRIEGHTIDTAKLQELHRRLATLQATLSTLGSSEQSNEGLQTRRRELLDDIARLELDIARRHDERSPTDGQVDTIQQQLDASRQELHALRQAIDELTRARNDGRTRLTKAEAAAANDNTHATEIHELNGQIDRWKSVLREAALRFEALGEGGSAVTDTGPHVDEFEAGLAALDTYLRDLELTSVPDLVGTQTWKESGHATKLQALQERLFRLRQQLGWQTTSASCNCERNQLTRSQAELQVSLRYLEEERDALAADRRTSPELASDIARMKQQLGHLDAKDADLQQRYETVTSTVSQQEIDLAAWQQRWHGIATDSTKRLAQDREELKRVEFLLSEVERRHALLESITQTQRQIQYVEDSNRESSILRAATSYLRRISGNDFQGIEVTDGKHVWVSDAKGHRLSWGHLSEAARDKVYLSLCLAIVEAHDQRSEPLPLIWKDVFTNFDSRQVPETAELLCNFARDGRQILLLTRHEHVASVFGFKNVPTRELAATQQWHNTANGVDQPLTHDVNHLLAEAGEAESVDLAWDPDQQLPANAEFFLFDDSPIEQSPSLGFDNAVRLRRLGITTVGELLEASVDEITSDLSYAGINSRMVADWQSQALLMCHVARLREYDARILVACGITGPSQLRQIPPVEVRAMIESFAESSEGRAMLLSGTEFELSRVTDWVRTEDGEPVQRRHQTRDMAGSNSRNSRGEPTSRGPSNRSYERGAHGSRTGRTGRTSRTGGTGRQSEKGTDAGAHEPNEQPADVVKMQSTSASRGLRFYLESNADVVDAPSIGPKSAERLEAIGVRTVSDFLAADPDDMAGRLQNRRMSVKMIRDWQRQTALVCRVPQLRGHDAQILVAVGVNEVEELAAMDPQELWTRVEPFVDTSAGKRIVRNSPAPDFEEVFHWIEWANQARALKVA